MLVIVDLGVVGLVFVVRRVGLWGENCCGF